MGLITAVGLEELACAILRADGKRVAKIVRVELSKTRDPGCILYLDEPGGRALTAWVWTHPSVQITKPTVIVERGFQAEPTRFPDWL